MPAMLDWLGGRVRRHTLVVSCCLAVLAGLLTAKIAVILHAWPLWSGLLALATLRRHNRLSLGCAVLFCFSLGLWQGSQWMARMAVNDSFRLQKVVLVARATEDGVYGDKSQMVFAVTGAQVVWPRPAQLVGNISIRGFGEPSIFRGDIVRIQGKIYPTRGNNVASISFAKLKVLRREPSAVDGMRRKFAAGMQSALPEPAASFGLGLLIGQRSTLPDDTANELRMAGLTHIIAVSGYNLTIIVEAMRRLMAKRSKFQSTASCVLLMGLFLLLTGLSPSIVRASIISLLSIVAWYYGRVIRPLTLILTAAAVTAFANPLYVWGNVSWYLSFLAFFGVLVLAPLVIGRWFKKPPGLVGRIVVESLCASVMTIAYILFIFGQISYVALVSNVLVAALVPLAMVLALVAGCVGMWWPHIAGFVTWPAVWILTYMLDMARLLSRLPHAFQSGIVFSVWHMAASYALIAGWWFLLTRKKRGIITDRASAHTERM